MTKHKLEKILEGILFTMGNAIETERIADALEIPPEEAEAALVQLQSKWEKEDRGVRLLRLENSWQMCTSRDIYDYLIRIAKKPKKQKLSDVVLETLSIVAYKQPVTRAEIEKIRGVSCEKAINRLVELNLIQELGRLDAPGRPMLFGTTEQFLRSLGVASIEDLPALNPVQVEEFRAEAAEEAEQMEVDV